MAELSLEEAVAAAGAPLLVLLSGGRDSVCLLDLAVRVHGAERVRALHVDYGLREESGADADFCRALCAERGVELEVVRAPAPPRQGNLQAWARDVRYAAAVARGRGAGRASPWPTPAPTRPRRSSTAWPPRPRAGRCSG